jgi:hypothetical protein
MLSKSTKQQFCAGLCKWELKFIKWLQLPFNGKPWVIQKFLSASVVLKIGAHPLTVTSILYIEFSDTALYIKPENERIACENVGINITSAYLSAAFLCTAQRFCYICKEER